MLKKVLLCAVVSMTPVLELRAALPMGIAAGIPIVPLYILCVVCNMIPIPFIILFMRKILVWMQKKGGKLQKTADWIENHAQKKLLIYQKYELLGLYIIVALPIPGTGAWTGGLVASFLGMRLKHAVPVILAGVMTAGLLMLLISFGLISIVM
jgi:uncharacterized membrane protein